MFHNIKRYYFLGLYMFFLFIFYINNWTYLKKNGCFIPENLV